MIGLRLLSAQESTVTGPVRQNSSAMLTKTTRISAGPIQRRLAAPIAGGMRIDLALKYLFAIALLLSPAWLRAQHREQVPFGIAWRVIGPWHVGGDKRSISTGDALVPGSLLEPAERAHDHSITILLPDGQRILYECFTSQDCVRGFRVPPLYRKPSLIAVDLLGRVNAIWQRKDSDLEDPQSQEESRVPRDEAVALIGLDRKIEVAGLAAALSNGTYSYVVRSVSHSSRKQQARDFEKRGHSVTLTLPSEGLFDMLISDHLNTPRIELLVAAVRQPRAAGVIKSFQDVKTLLKNWNEDYQGWPIHEFQRYYLRSLMLGIPPSPVLKRNASSSGDRPDHDEVTGEPSFFPIPGVFQKDTEVTLKCNTPGATMHYTVDGSQPVNESTVYHAPIMVRGTELTIKAFASAEGKKDSPVVTGIFRIGD
jgi:hypothetical protein